MASCSRGPMAHKAQALWEIYTSECCHLETLMLLCDPFLAALRHIQANRGTMQRFAVNTLSINPSLPIFQESRFALILL